jgi:hypothetical protein
MCFLQYNAGLLAPLSGLSSLHTLLLYSLSQDKGVEEVGQLPQLMHLELNARNVPEGLLLHVAQLKQLTYLTYTGGLNGESISRVFEQRVSLHGHCLLAPVVPTKVHVNCSY